MGFQGVCRIPKSCIQQDGYMTSGQALYEQLIEDPDVAFAVEVATRAGVLLADRPETLSIETKTSETDVVTHMDQLAEELIVSAIELSKPLDGLLGEEGAAKPSESGRQWVIDPIDGTINYLYQLPHWCVSIALVEEDSRTGIVGVVYAPSLDSLFLAKAGVGSVRVRAGVAEKLSVSDQLKLSQALVATGFGYVSSRRAAQSQVLTHVLPNVRDIRRLGSCALDLCLVAAGELDAYYERGVKPWDHSAGSIMVESAGGQVTGLFGQPQSEAMIVAGNVHVLPQLVSILELHKANQGD